MLYSEPQNLVYWPRFIVQNLSLTASHVQLHNFGEQNWAWPPFSAAGFSRENQNTSGPHHSCTSGEKRCLGFPWHILYPTATGMINPSIGVDLGFY
jgi:hypothetical protein